MARLLQQRHVRPVKAEALRGEVGVTLGELGVSPREDIVKATSHLFGELFGHALILGRPS